MIYLKNYKTIDYNKKEILRYMGCKEADEKLSEAIDECTAELDGKTDFKVCWTLLPIKFEKNYLDLTFMQTESEALKKNLQGCEKIVLFAATIGLETDRLIARYGIVSPLKSVIYQAIGTERVESLCDKFEDDIRNEMNEKGKFLRPRFSPGYGDFGLSAQSEIFKILDCRRKIGLTLNDTLLMSPSKSVTAIIGISEMAKVNCKTGCVNCDKADCIYRKGTQ